MPHITLVYPFVSVEQFSSLAERLRQACAEVAPFEVSLAGFESFRHRRGKHTVWLDPQPNDAVERLYVAIGNSLLDCDNEFKNSNRRFQPHLSVGQCQGREHTSQLVDQLQTAWEPVSFDVKKVSLISRNDPPDDVFLVENEIDLGN